MDIRRRLIATVVLLSAVTGGAADQDDAARAKAAYRRAIEVQAQGNHAGALSLFWEAAGLAPRDPDVQNGLGEALERLGALDAAIDAYRLALAARPGFRKAANNLILTLVKAGRGEEALERAHALVAAAPRDPDPLFTLGLAQAEQDVAAAIVTFRRVLEIAPGHALARYNLALVLKRADRQAEAVDELTRAIAIDPRPEAHYTLGVTYWHDGDLDRAVRALRSAIAGDRSYVDAHYTLGAVLKARGDWRGAAASLRRAIELRPDLWGAHNTLGLVLRQDGDEAGAMRHLAEAERLRRQAQREQEAGVWTAVGARKMDGGDLLGALDAFRRATTVLETYAPAHYQMGRVLQRLGEPEAARAAFVRAQQLNSSLTPPHVH